MGATIYTIVMLFVPVEQFAEYANLLHDWQPIAAVFVVAMLFGLFPDVDTNSRAQDIFYGVLFPLDALLIWNGNIHAAAFFGIDRYAADYYPPSGLDTPALGGFCGTATDCFGTVYL